ncbi:MAG: soluble lytic murein transglycosylase [Blastocatellia bacterium]|jgi:soluble lytic murein transglycosylase|nr:soluble lytic murein transglycosylase [Blastocatellia bacterium]
MPFFISLLVASLSLHLPVAARDSPLSNLAATAALSSSNAPAQDDALTATRRLDREGRDAGGKLAQLSAAEHLRRAKIYMDNRAFAEAREHWQTLIERFPGDAGISAALYGIGRSYFQEKRYEDALPIFQQLVNNYPTTKDGREGLYSLASTYLRLGRANEAVENYRRYTERFPEGERIEAAYLNVIDGLREAGRPAEALPWIAQAREKFSGSATATNALFARLRLDIAGGDWARAIQSADELRNASFTKDVMTNSQEVAYLKAYALERAGRTEEAVNAYLAIPDRLDSYYGMLATNRLLAIKSAATRPAVTARAARVESEALAAASQYPAPYREAIARAAATRKVDPRLVLAIMRQESGFRPRAKSQAAARGLLQLTIDTAHKYSSQVGLNNLQDDDLYRPEISILVGSEYLSGLTRLFPELPEAVAASYNGGEDNAARWLKRAGQRDAGIFTSEVGFAETKTYIYKVLANYRAYRQLYTQDLRPRH